MPIPITQTRWLWLAAILLLAALAAFWQWNGRSVEAVQVQRQPLVQSVVATGRITTPARMAIGSQVVAIVDAIPVREGDRVRAGEPVVQLRATDAEAALALAQTRLEQARLELDELLRLSEPVALQALRQAEADLQLAEREHQRTRELVAQRFYAPSSLDAAERTLRNAQAQLASTRTQWEATQPGGARHALALAQRRQAEAALEQARAERALLTLTAPVDALVLTREAEPGDVAQAGTALLSLAALGETRIYATLDEKNLRLLHEGMPARAITDAFAQQPFDAELYHISPAVDAQRGTVELRLRVPTPPAFLRPDMTASVEIIIGRREDALVLPAELLHDAGSAAPWVLALRGGRAVRVPVQTGLQGIGAVEITAGLQEGEWVVPPQANARAGQWLRPRRPPNERT
ncbi:efflux RND transporter periplasmic adaptor subunit [Corticibacter populi]|uniref:Efflux RND transporter periplasmic adaptor subunit n=1 Tax=Corticibacter populi TaxID=1550736 RepID=A0A3M6QS59_9BURK|nr:efflux RND transporter periplasmic adaptor subunit [Corticibacter populi]RMX05867.1 efflux RND transporter periplasmic adaptor subunit [Corticibacter populi]RZS30815.1 HlyD family secretion protein [Corticibacter populi]